MPTRLIRVLVYEGTHEQIQTALQARSVKGSYRITGGENKDLLIREAILGDFLEEFDHVSENDPNSPDDYIVARQCRHLWKQLGADNQRDALINLEEIRASRDRLILELESDIKG